MISVSDKEGLVPFAQGLNELGVEIISTGGTAKLLREHRIPVREVADFTGFPEILAGRVKTLHPRVHGGILARREDRRHLLQAKRLGLQLIDLVVVNLYPFEETARRRGISLDDLIEQIDIGGVSLIRSAAKNFQSVAVVTRPSDYGVILQEMERNGARLSEPTRRRLAVEAFAQTAYYDAVIHQVLAHRRDRSDGSTSPSEWPDQILLAAVRRQSLRYGENPHQPGAWYQWPLVGDAGGGLTRARQLHGKELSFNNLLDLDAALQIAVTFDRPCAVVVKHGNPCGVACASTLAQAFKRAFACDPLSAFGGIVGFNRPVDPAAARAVLSSGFLECLAAPGYDPKALSLLKEKKKNLRIMQAPESALNSEGCIHIKQIAGGLLVQRPDRMIVPPSKWRLVTQAKPTAAQRRDLSFAWTVARFVQSNAIVLVKGERTVGIGAGQASRVDSVRLALKKAGTRARGAALASDGFFPKPDGPAFAVKAGVRAIVQPGGSIQDPAVIQVAQQARVPMLLTGERHFRH